MKRIICLLLIVSACATRETSTLPTVPGIVPKPVSVREHPGYLTWNKRVSFISKDKKTSKVIELFSKQLLSIDSSISVTSEIGSEHIPITFSFVDENILGTEGYRLMVTESGVDIHANSEAGLFYGSQTLLQLIPAQSTQIRFIGITDYPRFGYRGLHLDVARHMFPVEFVKKYIDVLARHKMNRFHWHLTDDQGWRIEIKKYPRLQEVAAYRDETIVGHGSTATRREAKYDGKRYGGYYTQEEIREVVAYAAERHVTIIPEIEMPGHAQAAVTAYPNLGCTGGPYNVATSWGVFENVFCAGKEDSFNFLEGVLEEVIALFPGEYVHIGGDECPKTRWNNCTHCKKRMRDEKLKDAHELQSYFIQRMEKFLNSKGKRIVGWDEILEGGLAPNATVMSWRGEAGGIDAARQKHNVIMTPENWCYFDHYQDTVKTEPLAIGGLTPVKEVYEYEPMPQSLSAEESKFISGVQANLWTEYIETPAHAEYMVYPRACAMAEVAWSPKENKSWSDFLLRMEDHLPRLETWKVNYAPHIRLGGSVADK